MHTPLFGLPAYTGGVSVTSIKSFHEMKGDRDGKSVTAYSAAVVNDYMYPRPGLYNIFIVSLCDSRIECIRGGLAMLE